MYLEIRFPLNSKLYYQGCCSALCSFFFKLVHQWLNQSKISTSNIKQISSDSVQTGTRCCALYNVHPPAKPITDVFNLIASSFSNVYEETMS